MVTGFTLEHAALELGEAEDVAGAAGVANEADVTDGLALRTERMTCRLAMTVNKTFVILHT